MSWICTKSRSNWSEKLIIDKRIDNFFSEKLVKEEYRYQAIQNYQFNII